MDRTSNLDLPFILPSQAQKHVTHNDGLLALDALVQLAVLDRDLAAPPAGAPDGARFIVANAPTGEWAGHGGQIAARQDGAWTFHPPRVGWLAFLVDEAAFVFWSGTAWEPFGAALGALQNLSRLGLGTTADAANPFSAKLNKALWTARTAAEGGDGDLRYTLNKESAADVLSLLMQTGFAGRAELGLIGDDDLRLKVSADGTSFKEALLVDRGTGNVRRPSSCGFEASGSGQNKTTTADYQIISSTSFPGTFDAVDHDIGGVFNAANGRFTAPVAGRYLLYAGLYITGVTNEGRVCFAKNGVANLGFQLSFRSVIPCYLSRIFKLAASDYVELRTGNMNHAGGNSFSFWAAHSAFGGVLLA